MVDEKKDAPKRGGFSDYIERSTFYANIPQDPYSHQYQLINKPPMKIEHADQIIDSTIQLSNIGDKRTMILYQRDQRLINNLFDMAKRSLGVAGMFDREYYSWRGEMKMTAAYQGKERDLQSFLEPEEHISGFAFLKPKPKEKRRKKQLTDYLTPEEQGGIYE